MELHKSRCAAIAPLLTMGKIQSYAPFIQRLVNAISVRFIKEYAGQGKALVLNDVYGCLSGDVVSNLAFARSDDLVNTEHWESPFTLAVNEMVRAAHWMCHITWVVPMMNYVPDKLLMSLSSKLNAMITFQKVNLWHGWVS